MGDVYPCYRCDGYHEHVCSVCEFEPGCNDHNCWTTAELSTEKEPRDDDRAKVARGMGGLGCDGCSS